MSITLSAGMRLVAIGRYMHWCPGCNAPHFFNLSADDDGKKFTFNGDLDRPTFAPAHETLGCRYYLTNGVLEFLGDCTHEYRNRSVPLPAFPMRPLQPEPRE